MPFGIHVHYYSKLRLFGKLITLLHFYENIEWDGGIYLLHSLSTQIAEGFLQTPQRKLLFYFIAVTIKV